MLVAWSQPVWSVDIPERANAEDQNPFHPREMDVKHLPAYHWMYLTGTMQIQTILWKTGFAKWRPLTGEEGLKKGIKKVNMVDVFFIQE
jgi:hypothetical protein